MALSTMKTSLIIIFILSLIFVFALEEAEARRGGGGRGGSRGGSRGRTRSRGSSSGGGGSRPKNYNNVVLSGRIVKGSSPYNKGTWKKAAAAGLIFGGALYLTRSRTSRMYNDRMPIICTNKSYRSPEGKRYDYFICPLPDQNVTLKYCCGPKHGEYCCDKATAQRYYGEHHGSSSSSPAGIIVGIILVIIVICILVYCFKNRNSGPMSKIFKSKRRTRDESDLNLNHTNKHIKQSGNEHSATLEPLYLPVELSNDSHHHGAPDHPPPYSSSAAYDGSAGLAYAPPPPQMPGGFAAADPSTAPYPNASAPYPPPQAANPYPPPLDGAVNPPYPPPPDGGMNPPYPPMAPGAGNPPYPAPYPSEVPPYPGGVPAPAPSYDSYAAYPPYGPGSHSKI